MKARWHLVAPVFAFVALFLAGHAWGASEIELREKWVQMIVSVKKGVCADENSKNVVKKLDYAATLIMHNELEEARTILKKAGRGAKSAGCSEAISKSMRPPK